MRTEPTSAFVKILALILTGVTTLVVLTGQVSPTKSSRQGKSLHKKRVVHVIADSVAAARADSIRKVLEVKAIADSLQHRLDSLVAVQRADSLKAVKLRKIKNNAFGAGERLVFDVNYGFITAGEAVMAVAAYDTVADRACYRVEFTVNSLPSFSWIYRVEDRYLTFIDVEAVAPWKFEQHIREGNYRRDFIAEFDQIGHVAKTTEGVHPIPPYVHDIMSAFYYARTLDFSATNTGDIIRLHNFYKDTTHELGVKFLGRQELEVAAGTFNTIVVEPLIKEGGLFKSEGRIVIWLSDDERKIPVRVNTKVLIGSIDTELRQFSGLVGPLPSKVR